MDSPEFKEVPVPAPKQSQADHLAGMAESTRVMPRNGNRQPSMPVVPLHRYDPSDVNVSRVAPRDPVPPPISDEADRLRRMRESINPSRPREQFRVPPRQPTLDRTMTGIDLSDSATSALDAYLDE